MNRGFSAPVFLSTFFLIYFNFSKEKQNQGDNEKRQMSQNKFFLYKWQCIIS